MDKTSKLLLALVALGLFANLLFSQGLFRHAEAQGVMRCEVTNEVRVKGSLQIDTFGKPIAIKIDTFSDPLRVDVKK